jgi:pyruvate dehydrogenase E1 component beta subunit
MVGLRPVVEMMTFNFASLALDQIVNSAAKINYMSGGQLNVPIVIRGPGGRRRSWPPSTRSRWRRISSRAWFEGRPPDDADGCQGPLKSSIRDDNPVIFIESETLYNVKGEVPEDPDFSFRSARRSCAAKGPTSPSSPTWA